MKKKSQQNNGLLGGFYEQESKKYKDRAFEKEKEGSPLYDVFQDKEDSTAMPDYPKHTLSTRYVPNMPGVQAGRMPGQEGAFYNPITNKEYSFKEGFELDGVKYPAYSVSMQTNLYSLAKSLKDLGFKKEADRILNLIK